MFGIQKFHQYIYGRRFMLLTDHQTLVTILSPKTGVPALAAARMQRWALLLSAYTYDIVYRSTKDHANADGLSRLPHSATTEAEPANTASKQNVKVINGLPVKASEVASASRYDPIITAVHRYRHQGWPHTVPEELKPYRQRKDEITAEGKCLLWGSRVVIPTKL